MARIDPVWRVFGRLLNLWSLLDGPRGEDVGTKSGAGLEPIVSARKGYPLLHADQPDAAACAGAAHTALGADLLGIETAAVVLDRQVQGIIVLVKADPNLSAGAH